jgi:hypothetical protein
LKKALTSGDGGEGADPTGDGEEVVDLSGNGGKGRRRWQTEMREGTGGGRRGRTGGGRGDFFLLPPLFPSVVGGMIFCILKTVTVHDAKQFMHLLFCIGLLDVGLSLRYSYMLKLPPTPRLDAHTQVTGRSLSCKKNLLWARL